MNDNIFNISDDDRKPVTETILSTRVPETREQLRVYIDNMKSMHPDFFAKYSDMWFLTIGSMTHLRGKRLESDAEYAIRMTGAKIEYPTTYKTELKGN